MTSCACCISSDGHGHVQISSVARLLLLLLVIEQYELVVPHLLHLETQTMLEQHSVAQLRPPFRGLAWVQAVPGSCRFPAHVLLARHC